MVDGKLLPAFKEGERIVVGYLLVHSEAMTQISRLLPSSAISEPKLKKIYEIITTMFGSDSGLVLHEIETKLNDPDIITQLEEWIRELELIDTLDIFGYVDKLLDAHKRRMGIEASRKAEAGFFNYDKTAAETAAVAVTDLVDRAFVKETLIGPEEYVARRISGLEKRGQYGHVPTGFRDIDALLTTGFSPGELSVIAGRTSMGKSTFKRNLIVRLCDAGLSVVNFVPEVSFDREQDGIDCIRTGRKIKDFYRPSQWDDVFKQDIRNSSDYIATNWKYVVQEDPYITYDGFELDLLHRQAVAGQIDVVFIDLFDRIKEVREATHNKTNIVNNLLQRQSAFTKKHGIHICNLVQIRRLENKKNVDKDKKNIPTLEDLKDSGAFEETGDTIMLCYRPSYYDNTKPDDTMEVIIAKQRVGPRNKTVTLLASWENLILDDI